MSKILFNYDKNPHFGVIGCGIVGEALATYMDKRRFTAHRVDPARGLSDDLVTCVINFICVPAPTKLDGTQDLSMVKDAIKHCLKFSASICIRTTLLPGTTKRLAEEFNRNILYWPEFLLGSDPLEGIEKHPKVIGSRQNKRKAEFVKYFKKLFRFRHIYYMTTEQAELFKYAHNVYTAVRVGYLNVLSETLKKVSGDDSAFSKVVKILNIFDDIMPRNKVPGPDGKYGWGGHCITKDTAAFESFLMNLKIPHSIIKGAIADNDLYRKK